MELKFAGRIKCFSSLFFTRIFSTRKGWMKGVTQLEIVDYCYSGNHLKLLGVNFWNSKDFWISFPFCFPCFLNCFALKKESKILFNLTFFPTQNKNALTSFLYLEITLKKKSYLSESLHLKIVLTHKSQHRKQHLDNGANNNYLLYQYNNNT